MQTTGACFGRPPSFSHRLVQWTRQGKRAKFAWYFCVSPCTMLKTYACKCLVKLFLGHQEVAVTPKSHQHCSSALAPLGCCSIVLTHLIHLILLTRIGRFFLRFSSLIATSIVLSCHNLASKIKINLSFPCKVGPSDNELFALDSKPT